jgi:glycine/D-amino acid oxidase-like deaminating enzyme
MSARAPAPDVAVIGGGIVGTATAAFLAAAGLRVRLYERAAIAAGASGRNSGIVQHPFDPVLAGLYRRSVDAYRGLSIEGDAGFTFPDEPAGLLYLGRDVAMAHDEASRWAAAWPASRPEVLEGSALSALEPAIVGGISACRLAIGYPVEPAAATLAFAELARARGVEIVIGDDVGIAVDGSRAIGVDRAGAVEGAGAVVVAAGPWTPSIVDPTGSWRPIRAVWGVVASIALADAPRHGLESIDIDIEPGGDAADGGPDESDAGVDFSLVPVRGGSSALGSTFLTEEPVPADWLDRIRRVGARYVPAVASAPLLGVRHCARPVSLDGRPLVGPASWCEGLWVAAGNGPWGISTGPGTARVLVDRMLDAGSAALPAALAVDRLGVPGQRQDSASNT